MFEKKKKKSKYKLMYVNYQGRIEKTEKDIMAL